MGFKVSPNPNHSLWVQAQGVSGKGRTRSQKREGKAGKASLWGGLSSQPLGLSVLHFQPGPSPLLQCPPAVPEWDKARKMGSQGRAAARIFPATCSTPDTHPEPIRIFKVTPFSLLLPHFLLWNAPTAIPAAQRGMGNFGFSLSHPSSLKGIRIFPEPSQQGWEC